MTKKRLLKFGVLLMLGVFVLGASIPAMAAVDNNTAGNGQGQGQGFMYRAQTMIKSLAELTGLDIADIQSERHEGKSILDIAEENGVDQEVLTEKITTANQEKLQERLNDGTITQEQYDDCFTQMNQRIQERLERSTTGGLGNGNYGMMGQRGHGQGQGQRGSQGRGNCNANCQI